jgi:thiol-disulfide isomerase/thioredoxin
VVTDSAVAIVDKCRNSNILVSQISFHIRIRIMGIVAAVTAVLVASCVSTAPKHLAPVVAPIPEPAQVTKVYPVEQPPPFVGEELKGSVLPDPAGPRVLLGTSLNGAPVYLSDYRGKVVVASYWASWCPPCWTELPQLEDIHTEYNGRGVEIVAINVGEVRTAIDSFLQQQQKPLRFTIVSDRTERASVTQGVTAVPTTLVFDAAGKVFKRYVRVSGFKVEF